MNIHCLPLQFMVVCCTVELCNITSSFFFFFFVLTCRLDRRGVKTFEKWCSIRMYGSWERIREWKWDEMSQHHHNHEYENPTYVHTYIHRMNGYKLKKVSCDVTLDLMPHSGWKLLLMATWLPRIPGTTTFLSAPN